MASQSSQIFARFMVSTEEQRENMKCIQLFECGFCTHLSRDTAIIFKFQNQKSKRNVMVATIE